MFWRKRKPGRPRAGDKTIEELRVELQTYKEENKKLKAQNSQLRTILREERLKKKEWHTRWAKLRQKLEELK